MKINRDFDTMVDALNDLMQRGYTEDFNLLKNGLDWISQNLRIHPEEFKVDEFYRFEGMTNPSDSSIVYAISSEKYKVKGVLVDAYGLYSDHINSAMIQKLQFRKN
ncbi:MAG TPA: phosphoribosylpyrophosphate synthetase [Saprospiraceae bacterium]|nr:phosphoribosylpyrophosphate synthetase [Saprospiraceae bacterium]